MTKFLSSLLVISSIFMGQLVTAQTLTADKVQLAFGNATEIAPVNQTVTLTNSQNYPVTVTGIRVFNIYGEPAFSITAPATLPFTIPASGTQTVTVKFSPKHNIAHNSEMVFETNARGGNLAVDLTGQGKYSKTYYNNSENLSEQALKTALKTIISANYNSLNYNGARDQMFMTIDNKKTNGQGASVNTIECVYTGRRVVGYTSRTDAQNTGDTTKNFNTEHTFPQGYFNEAEPMRSDLHHLFPTDNPANGSRGNQPFGVATLPYKAEHINAPSHYGANNLYEPRDVHKGATARAMLYFVIRYQDYQNFFTSQEAILKTWNNAFAPTAVDMKRNDDIAAPNRQRNRNPFVDYPQFANRITNFVSNSTAPASYELYNKGMVNYGQIPANTTVTHHYVLVNNGNQTMNFTNPTLSNTTLLSFAAGSGANFSIAPGQAYTLKINVNLPTADSISEMLTLGTNIPNQATLSIPVYANKTAVVNAVSGEKAKFAFELYPNPVTETFVIERPVNMQQGKFEVIVTDALGRQVSHLKNVTDGTAVSVSDLKRGIYMVRVVSGNEFLTKKIVKL